MSITEQHETVEQHTSPEITRMLRRDVRVVGVIAVVMALVVGAGVLMHRHGQATPKPAPVTAVAPTAGTVSAHLSEWKVGLDKTTVSPGRYTFNIDNTGTVEHELIAFKLSSPTQAIPVDRAGDVNEDALTNATDGENIAPGGAQTRSVDLTAPGTYIFMCNIAGHYHQGMHVLVTVTK